MARACCTKPLCGWTKRCHINRRSKNIMDWRMDQLSERNIYKLLVSTVLPRPIALVTTCNANGGINAAPFSFFNVMGSEPPIVALGIEANPDKQDGLKDTARNIACSSEFVVNLVDEAL